MTLSAGQGPGDRQGTIFLLKRNIPGCHSALAHARMGSITHASGVAVAKRRNNMQEFTDRTQSRKWLLTINNPQICGLDHAELIDRLQKFNPDYFCMADEIGATGTYHRAC